MYINMLVQNASLFILTYFNKKRAIWGRAKQQSIYRAADINSLRDQRKGFSCSSGEGGRVGGRVKCLKGLSHEK